MTVQYILVVNAATYYVNRAILVVQAIQQPFYYQFYELLPCCVYANKVQKDVFQMTLL
jgi:hypothetical protein